ncbi:peptidase S8/S53 domain-containing protein [Lasiosphaeria miniovina]|uniref:tripeptidyl-peptidase II n=1 Tax=Lasiosphaeria miniovina TaxID=1954250 RepID=A0AA40ACU1_9PEZI|nr:peptidase S8/S53 domain-containing protein [Lasiosphaeria miniovina]KAK0713486.1 peptidase S8/S53 domain-containing protein [Lasiosphaeria miniovina]
MRLQKAAEWVALLSAALPTANAAVHHQWDTVPKGWTATNFRTASTTQMTLSIALNMQNIDQLESLLLSISTPGQPSYGKFLDVGDVTSKFSPSKQAISSVTNWLKQNGIKNFAVNGAFIDFAADVATANKLLGADYQHYTNNGVTKLRTLSYSIPDNIQSYVALVDPSTYFGNSQAFLPLRPRPSRVRREPSADLATRATVDASCQTSITPSCLKQLYNVGSYTPSAKSGSTIGFGSFLNQSALYSDLAAFEQFYGIPSQNFTVELIAGGVDDQNPATAQIGEADLDVENIVGIAHPLPVREYITGGSPPFVPNIDQPTPADNFNEPYVPYYRYLLSKKNSELPQVISNSYGDAEDSVPYNYAVLTCNMIGMLGLRGITTLFSSGDVGVGSGCLAPDYKTVEFNAIFPATCPYLTSVGGTVDVTPEIAWEGSSGGFSKYFPRPAYQSVAIAQYLKTVSPETYKYYAPYTNWQGRGFPDVAGHSVDPDYQVIYFGRPRPSGGTSAAAPVWAGIVGMLNDARFRAGKKSPLGWLNPLIYTFGPQVLTDITGGFAIGCNGNNTQSGGPEPAGSGIVLGARWNATKGWDPTTGYGTPDFEKLKKLVLSF